jgi:hypothetical protein
MRHFRLVVSAVCAMASAASPIDAQAVRDSAGIRIVENSAPSLSSARAWRIDPKPLLVIGGETATTAGDSLYEFGGVMGLARLSNGQWAIGVQSANQIRFYDANGKYVKSAGRAGQGPGEFRQIMGLKVVRADTLIVTDQFEIEYFTGAGQFVGLGASRTTMPGTYVWPQAVFANGSYVGFDYNDRTISPAGRSVRVLPMYAVSDRGRRIDTLAVLPISEMVFDGRRPSGNPVTFAPSAMLATVGERVFYAYPTTAAVSEYDRTGRLFRSVRLALPVRPVSAADRQDYLEWVTNLPGELGGPITPQVRAINERRAASTVFADNFPTHGLMLADRGGSLWLRRFDVRERRHKPGPVATITVPAPTNWDVLDTNGRWLCTLSMPAHFTPLEIGADYVAGVSHDSDDVESIHVYRIVKP